MWSTNGWWYYYLVAFLYKSTIPFLLLLIAAVYGLIKHWRSQPAIHFTDLPLFSPILWLVLPPLVLIYILSFHYQINFGIRYLLPAFPFLILVAGYGIKTLLQGKKSEVLVLGALLTWQILASTLAAPEHLAYFNETAGDPYLARDILLDSNLDWGQDLGRLKDHMTKNRIDRIRLGYFGCVDPKLYGIEYSLPPFEFQSGLYAISANYLSGLPPALTYLDSVSLYAPNEYWTWLDDYQPVARVGSSIYIFRITENDKKK
jgi:uncharacterized membrane protein